MTTATLPATVGTLDHPTRTITTGREYDVLPDGGHPLRYWRTAYGRLEQHSNYTGNHRPTRVVVNRCERNGSRDSNVNVTFTDPAGVTITTWVHHSFLVDVGTVQQAAVTIEQKVEWLSEYMASSIGSDEWPDAGNPEDWDQEDFQRWLRQGCRAVLERRTDIENGSTTAGVVWCAANEDDFSYDHTTEEYLHAWFRDRRDRIDVGLAGLVGQILPQADPNSARSLVTGDLVARGDVLYRVARNQTGDTVLAWTHSPTGRQDQAIEIPRSEVRWLEPGVARLRRKNMASSSYGEVCVRGNEYVFDRVYSPQDQAIYVRNVDSTAALGYMSQDDFTAIPLVPSRRWDQGRVERTKQTAYTPNGEVGLVLADDNVVHTDRRAGTINVYKRNTGAWRDSMVAQAEVNFAVVGDPIINHDVTGLFVRNYNDEHLVVTVNGVEAQWRRQDCRYTGTPAAEKQPIENLVVVVDGVEYVRKDVIEKDIATMTTVLHKGSVEHSLCGVYDRVTAEADRRTDFIKMGPRYKTYEVEVEQTLVVRRTIRVESVVDEAAARTNARDIAQSYTLRNIPARHGNEVVRIQSATNTDHVGTVRVVS